MNANHFPKVLLAGGLILLAGVGVVSYGIAMALVDAP